MFLDREPYLRYWKPTYRIFGPSIRLVKGFTLRLIELLPIGRRSQLDRIELQITKLQASQQEFYSILEQIVMSSLADRQIDARLTNREARLIGTDVRCAADGAALEELLKRNLTEMENRLSRENALLWAAIEDLLFAFLASPDRNSTVASADEYAARRRDAAGRAAGMI